MTLQLSFASGVYDRTVPLLDGSVRPAGIQLNHVEVEPIALFERQARHAEFDVAEFSLATHAILVARGDRRMVAIPAFISRKFRHSDVYVNTKAGIQVPRDLADKRVGVQEYQQTAAVWIRGMLQHEYGVVPDQVHWHFGGFNAAGPYHERIPITLPPSIRVTTIPEQTSLDQMLDRGELDAVIGAQAPLSFQRGSPNVARLFPNSKEVEVEYYRRAGIFPIMHLVVLRREIYERSPEIATSLYQAFLQAKAIAEKRLRFSGVLGCTLPWLTQHLEEMDTLLGPDPFSYGLEKNGPLLETFLQYLHEQGLTERRLGVADLFARGMLV
jgi:4,5-dihydroxyphthalate decarboxylase